MQGITKVLFIMSLGLSINACVMTEESYETDTRAIVYTDPYAIAAPAPAENGSTAHVSATQKVSEKEITHAAAPDVKKIQPSGAQTPLPLSAPTVE